MSNTYGSCTCNPQFITFEFTGTNSYGTVSCPGIKAGDRVHWFSNNHSTNDFVGGTTIQTDDQFDQLSGADYSSSTFSIMVSRWS